MYEADSSRMSPFMRDFSKVMLSHFFHRPQQAIDDTKRLLKLHENEVGDILLLPLMQLLAKNYSALGNNSEAKNVMDKLIWLFEKQSSEELLASLRPSRDVYEALSHYDLYRLEDAHSTYNVPFELREVGDSAQALMFVKGRIGGKKADFVFDTGAAYNVITPELAKAYGLKMLDASQEATGMKTINGNIAVAERLQIGGIVMHDVPFIVLDITQRSKRAARAMQPLQLIIGLPFMQQFGSYDLDFVQNELTFHSDKTAGAGIRPNLCMTAGDVMQADVEADGHHYAMNLDTGATESWMGNDYYNDHKALVSRLGKWEIKAGAGYGGVGYNSLFRLPEVQLSIGGQPFGLKKIAVMTLSTEKGSIGAENSRLGIDFYRMWKRVTVDNTNMRISLF